MAIEKIKIVTENGKQFKFEPRKSDEDIPCSDLCKYSAICDKLPDPSGDAKCFSEYCLKINSSGDSTTESFFLPVDLENSFASDNKDIFREILEKDPVVKLTDVISSVCADGFCDSYTPTCENCKSNNMTCILRNLLLKAENRD